MFLAPEFAIYLLIIITGFFIGIISVKRRAPLYPVVLLLGITFLCELVSRIFAYKIGNSYPPYHILNLFQSALWGVFFYRQFKTRHKKQLSLFLSSLLVIYSIINTINEGFLVMPYNDLKAQAFVLIALGFTLFFEKLEEGPEVNIFKDPIFITVVGLIWFSLVSFIFINFHKFLVAKVFSDSILRLINYVSNYVYYLTLLAAIILQRTKK